MSPQGPNNYQENQQMNVPYEANPPYKAPTNLGKFYSDLPKLNDHFKNKYSPNNPNELDNAQKMLAIKKKSEMIENFRNILKDARRRMKELRGIPNREFYDNGNNYQKPSECEQKSNNNQDNLNQQNMNQKYLTNQNNYYNNNNNNNSPSAPNQKDKYNVEQEKDKYIPANYPHDYSNGHHKKERPQDSQELESYGVGLEDPGNDPLYLGSQKKVEEKAARKKEEEKHGKKSEEDSKDDSDEVKSFITPNPVIINKPTTKKKKEGSDNIINPAVTPSGLIVQPPNLVEDTPVGSSHSNPENNGDLTGTYHVKLMEQLNFLREEVNQIHSVLKILEQHHNKGPNVDPTLQGLNIHEKQLITHTLDTNNFPSTLDTKSNNFGMSPKELSDLSDINDLQNLIKKIDERLNVMIINKGEVQKVTEKLKNHEDEIENLRRLLDTLVKSSNTNQSVDQSRKLQESIKKLKEMLEDFDPVENKEYMVGSTRHQTEPNIEDHMRKLEERLNSLTNPEEKEAKDTETMDELIDAVEKIATISRKQEKIQVDSKLERMEKELRQLAEENKKAKQELLVAKMQKEINDLMEQKQDLDKKKNNNMESKTSEMDTNDKILAELADLKRKIDMNQPQMKMNDEHKIPEDEVQHELKKLQDEIDSLSSQKTQELNKKDELADRKSPKQFPDLDVFSDINVAPSNSQVKPLQTSNANNYGTNYQNPTRGTIQGVGGSNSFVNNNKQMRPTQIVYQVPFCLQPTQQQQQQQQQVQVQGGVLSSSSSGGAEFQSTNINNNYQVKDQIQQQSFGAASNVPSGGQGQLISLQNGANNLQNQGAAFFNPGGFGVAPNRIPGQFSNQQQVYNPSGVMPQNQGQQFFSNPSPVVTIQDNQPGSYVPSQQYQRLGNSHTKRFILEDNSM